MATNSIKLLTGNSHPQLAKQVANRYVQCAPTPHLQQSPGLKSNRGCSRLGIELTKIMVLQYSNQETSVTIGESVRDEDGAFSAFIFLCSPLLLPHTAPISLCPFPPATQLTDGASAPQSSSYNPPRPATSTTGSWNS